MYVSRPNGLNWRAGTGLKAGPADAYADSLRVSCG